MRGMIDKAKLRMPLGWSGCSLDFGKYVIVYRPTNMSKGDKWSSKLLFQFKGPYRIIKVHRTAVHLKSLSGQPEPTQNLRNVYPYHCHVDDMVDSFHRDLLSKTRVDGAAR